MIGKTRQIKYEDSDGEGVAPGHMPNSISQKGIPSVSVIILNYNGRRHLEDCFGSIVDINYPKDKVEVIMVDNGSTDGSVAMVEEHFSGVHIVNLESNLGFSKGNNIGVQNAKNEYVAFLNNDTIVDKDWLWGLVFAVQKEPRLIVNSKVAYFHRRGILNIGRGYMNSWGVGFCKGAGEPHDRYDKTEYIHHATGGSMLMKRRDFIELGGFDEDFFAYHEDVDFGWRAWICGYKILYVPGSIVYHKSGGTAGAFSPLKTYLITRNTLTYIVKNRESLLFFPMLLTNIFFDLVAVIYFASPLKRLPLRYGQSLKISWAILSGILGFMALLPQAFRKRSVIQRKRKESDKILMEKGLIMPFAESVRYLFKSQFRAVECLIEAEKAG